MDLPDVFCYDPIDTLEELEQHLLKHGIRFDNNDTDKELANMRYYHMEDHTQSSPMGKMPFNHIHKKSL